MFLLMEGSVLVGQIKEKHINDMVSQVNRKGKMAAGDFGEASQGSRQETPWPWRWKGCTGFEIYLEAAARRRAW